MYAAMSTAISTTIPTAISTATFTYFIYTAISLQISHKQTFCAIVVRVHFINLFCDQLALLMPTAVLFRILVFDTFQAMVGEWQCLACFFP